MSKEPQLIQSDWYLCKSLEYRVNWDSWLTIKQTTDFPNMLRWLLLVFHTSSSHTPVLSANYTLHFTHTLSGINCQPVALLCYYQSGVVNLTLVIFGRVVWDMWFRGLFCHIPDTVAFSHVLLWKASCSKLSSLQPQPSGEQKPYLIGHKDIASRE